MCSLSGASVGNFRLLIRLSVFIMLSPMKQCRNCILLALDIAIELFLDSDVVGRHEL